MLKLHSQYFMNEQRGIYNPLPLMCCWSSFECILIQVFTCAANTGTAVHNHRGAPWRPRPTGAQALDCSLPPLKYMLTKVQHGWSTFGHSKVWPADIEVVAHLPRLSWLKGHRGAHKNKATNYTLSFEHSLFQLFYACQATGRFQHDGQYSV